MRSRYTAILLMLIVFGVGFVLGNARISHKTSKKNPQAVKRLENIPRVDGRITKVIASPDFTRIALLIEDKKDYIAIFDPAKKRIIARVRSGGYGEFRWSFDSKWLVAEADKSLVLINKNGNTRLLHKEGWKPVWRPGSSNKFVYTSEDPLKHQNALREYDISTKKDRIILLETQNECIGYFAVKERIFAAFLYEIKPHTLKKIEVVDIDSKRKIVSVPWYGILADSIIFDMSPDGKTFAINAYASGGCYFIIGRTSEAATTLKHLNRAVLYESYSDNENVVVWALSSSPSSEDTAITNKDPNYALVNSDSFPLTMLNLVDSSSYFVAGHMINITYITWWIYNAKSDNKQQFLVVNSEGLWITSEPKFADYTISSKDADLILRHKN